MFWLVCHKLSKSLVLPQACSLCSMKIRIFKLKTTLKTNLLHLTCHQFEGACSEETVSWKYLKFISLFSQEDHWMTVFLLFIQRVREGIKLNTLLYTTLTQHSTGRIHIEKNINTVQLCHLISW